MIRNALEYIANNYLAAKQQSFTKNPLAIFLRSQAPQIISTALDNKHLITTGSAGQSQWATIPWIAIFYPPVTTQASQGHYIVYLFSEDMSQVCISFNQAVTPFIKLLGEKKAYNELVKKSRSIRENLHGLPRSISNPNIKLSNDETTKYLYDAGHIIGRTYDVENLPKNSELTNDLNNLVKAYLQYAYAGDSKANYETYTDELEHAPKTVLEARQYGFHRRIERNPNTSRKVKAVRKPICDACGFEFKTKYGSIGQDFIEVHHKKPISTLPENETFEFDLYKDFDVLCSNCHRMIHRTNDPSDLEVFKKHIKKL